MSFHDRLRLALDQSIPLPPGDYARYLGSGAWKAKRKEALRLAGWKCYRCHWRRNLQVHHKTYERLGCELMEDLVVLCRLCHKLQHSK